MKRLVPFLLLLAFSLCAWTNVAWSMPAKTPQENTRIGENGREAKKAAKQQQKINKRMAKQQRKAMKRYQKAQRKAAKQQGRRTR
jgi:hypothetical protein